MGAGSWDLGLQFLVDVSTAGSGAKTGTVNGARAEA